MNESLVLCVLNIGMAQIQFCGVVSLGEKRFPAKWEGMEDGTLGELPVTYAMSTQKSEKFEPERITETAASGSARGAGSGCCECSTSFRAGIGGGVHSARALHVRRNQSVDMVLFGD